MPRRKRGRIGAAPSGDGRLLWHALGAKITELINEHVHLELIRGDLETPVLDADVLEDLLLAPDLKKTKEVELKIAFRLRKHRGDPRLVALGERLEELRERHEQGQLSSLEFLKSLLELARDVVGAEKEVEPGEEIDRGKAALPGRPAHVLSGETARTCWQALARILGCQRR